MAKVKNLKGKLTLVVLGRSGSGKGTQAHFILQRLKRQGVFHLETGRFLRELLAQMRAGRAVNQAVVIAFLGVFAFNYVFTQTLLATHPEITVIR